MCIYPCVPVNAYIYCSLYLFAREQECVYCCLNVCAKTMHLHTLNASICTLTQCRVPGVCTSKNIKCHEQLCLHMGKAMHTLVLQIDGNEIFFNLNVNGSEIYRWVLCNYRCHNLLELCLCKVESKKRRI